jgi:lysophospholipid acyltransferase (LPLAT)-like uncharacterized protein
VPFGFQAHWKIRLKSWDRFQIPLPFSRCDLRVGELIYVPRDTSPAQREEIRKYLEDVLKSLSKD